jgi:hypothetical protein
MVSGFSSPVISQNYPYRAIGKRTGDIPLLRVRELRFLFPLPIVLYEARHTEVKA